MNNIKMLYFDRIDVFKGTDVNKTRYLSLLVFLNKGFKFQPYVCNRCHDLLMMSMNVTDIAILSINNTNYHCIITGISKSQTTKLLQSIDLTKKSGTYNYQEQFWCYKFIRNSNLINKIENYKLKKYIKIFESIYENRRKIY